MKIITFGDIMESGNSVFTAISQMDNDNLIVKFKGMIKTNNPYKDLNKYIKDMEVKLKETKIGNITIDFTDLKYCNSNGFYVLMDIMDTIYNNTLEKITVKRLKLDDWHQETLPILLNINDEKIAQRLLFIDEDEI
jgi:hypothetical protein